MQENLETKIQEIAAKALYLDDPSEVSLESDLFNGAGMSSLDFVDFCYELENQVDSQLTPEIIWPIPYLMGSEEYWDGDAWTQKGRQKLSELFADESMLGGEVKEKISNGFTVNFVAQQVRKLKQ